MEQNTARHPPLVSTSDIAKILNLEKKHYIRKVKQMKENRQEYETRWKEIRDYQLPHVGWFENTGDRTNPARRKDTKIYNGIAWESNQIFASGIMSGLTPQNRRWFRLNFANKELSDNTETSKLLDERMDILNDVLNKSNFYNAIHSTYLELAFGQAVLAIFPDAERGVHFTSYTIGSYLIESGPDGSIDTFCWIGEMTAQQLADKFGEDALTENIRQELKSGAAMKTKHKLYWFVEPNRMKDQSKLGRWHMPFISLYWLEEAQENEWLYIGGFYEWPVPVGRFLVSVNESYGKGPGWFAMADAMQLQLMEKDKLTLVELMAKPPIQTDPETEKLGINLIPGGKTVTGQGENSGAKPIFQVSPNLDALQMTIKETEERIKRTYAADLFRMIDSQEKTMTAREVIERMQEKMQQLGPVVQRMQSEFLSKIIERVYMILDRANVFPAPQDPDMAEILAQQEIKIEYISPLAQAQKMSGITNIEQALSFMGVLAQFHPEILDRVDYDETLKMYFDLVGAPASIVRSDEEYQKLLQQKQEAMQQQQQMQQAVTVANAMAPAAQAAKNATEAANDGNPALQQLLGYNELGRALGVTNT